MPAHPPHLHAFGHDAEGHPLYRVELHAACGVRVEVISWGASLRRIQAPDRHGHLDDVLLGLDDAAAYCSEQPYLGAIAGRIAGRVRHGRITIDGVSYQLDCQDGPHHLHGGRRGLSRRRWEMIPLSDGAICCRIRSADGDEGYPGDVLIDVVYRLDDDGTLHVDSTATSTVPTPISLTSHGYFNLAGHGDILQHHLTIAADELIRHDEHFGLLSDRAPVTGSDDVRHPRLLAEVIPGLDRQHGSLYRLRPAPPATLRPVARVEHRPTGRVLEVATDQPYLQCYTGAYLDGSLVGLGRRLTRFAGLCLECEGYPDGSTRPDFGDILARPEHPRRQRTTYRFTTA